MDNKFEIPSSVVNDKDKAEEMAYAGKSMRDRANKNHIVSEKGAEFLKKLAERQENKAGSDYERKKEYEEMGLDAEKVELHPFIPKEIDEERLEEDYELEERQAEYLEESIINVLKNKKIVEVCKGSRDDRENFIESLAHYVMDDLLSKHFSPEALKKENDHDKKYDPYGKTPRIVFEKRILERQVYPKDKIMKRLSQFITKNACEINQASMDHNEKRAKAIKKQRRERSQIEKE